MSPSARQQLAAYGTTAKKSWGQNFLEDQGVLRAIVAADADVARAPCVELGAGLGALTRALLDAGAHVVAIERDRELVPSLRALAALREGRLEVQEADAQTLDWAQLRERLAAPVHVFGNLPYQLSSRILVSLAEAGPAIEHAVLLVQKEVAERLVAGPPGRTYGLLSVLVQRRFVARIVRHVPPGAFYPRPNVDSTVVALRTRTPQETLCANAAEEAAMVQAARAAFAARRKTLRNSVAVALDHKASVIGEAIAAAGLDPLCRAETLPLSAFVVLGRALSPFLPPAGAADGPMP